MVAVAEPTPIDDLPDAELVDRFKRGDDRALEVLLHRHHDALYRYCWGLVGNQTEAEDVCQESLTRAIARIGTLHSGAAFRSWLFRIARNLSMDAFRHGKRLYPLPDEESPFLLSAETGLQEHIEQGEERQTVVAALTTLTPRHQQVLLLRDVEGLSYAEIARRLETSQSAVETLLFRARRRLREEYLKREAPVAGVGVLAGLRTLAARLLNPLPAAPFVAKALFTVVLVGTSILAVPRLTRPIASHAAAQPSVAAAPSKAAALLPIPHPAHLSPARKTTHRHPRLALHHHRGGISRLGGGRGRAWRDRASSRALKGHSKTAVGTSAAPVTTERRVSRRASRWHASHSRPSTARSSGTASSTVASSIASATSLSKARSVITDTAALGLKRRSGSGPARTDSAIGAKVVVGGRSIPAIPTPTHASMPVAVPTVPPSRVAGHIPTVALPRVVTLVPTVSVPHVVNVRVPTVAVPTIPVRLPTVSVPSVSVRVPTVAPRLPVPTVSVPHVTLPTVQVQRILPTATPRRTPTPTPTPVIKVIVPTVSVKVPTVTIGGVKP